MLRIGGVSDPGTLEAIACREALALARDLSLQRITVATDCLEVVNNMTRPYAGSYCTVLHEIAAQKASFVQVLFRHENRASNSEAHKLARFATSSSLGRQLWLLQPPDGLCIMNNIE
jgi:ribonuclease HI